MEDPDGEEEGKRSGKQRGGADEQGSLSLIQPKGTQAMGVEQEMGNGGSGFHSIGVDMSGAMLK